MLLTINLIFTTRNFLLPVTQTHLIHSDLCPSTSSLVHFYSDHKKTQFKCHHPLHEAFLTSTNKIHLSWPYNPTARWTYHSISLIPVHWSHCGFPIISSPSETVTFSKERLHPQSLYQAWGWEPTGHSKTTWDKNAHITLSTVPSAQSFITGQLKLEFY